MAKGKKTLIKEIKKISDDIVSINGKEYVIIEDEENIESAISMKISSHGNRILRFEDLSKKATIDVKRDIDVYKVSFSNEERAATFKKTYDKKIISEQDKKDLIANANSHIKARTIISDFTKKSGENYDKKAGITNFYITEENK